MSDLTQGPRNTKRNAAAGILVAVVALLHATAGMAQVHERLTLQDAIARTLKHNFDISIQDLALQQAARNNTLGNAGFSPTILLNATATQSRNNVHSQLANGTEQNNPNAVNTTYNPLVTINWTIFDGGKMFLVKRSLNEIEALTEVQLRTQIQTVVSRTIQTYAQVVMQQQQLVAVDTAIQLAKVRMDITSLKYETGAGAKVDYLQALVDHNARRSDSLNFIAAYTQASDSLAVLMGENEDKLYTVDDSLALNTRLTPIDRSRLAEENLTLNMYRRNAELSHLNADIAKTYFLPTVSLNGGYGYNRSESATGFALFTRSYGGSGGINLTMPIFSGGNIRRQSKVATLQAMRDDLVYEKQNTVIGKQFRTAWRNYQLAVAAYNLNLENIGFAKENLGVQIARFRVGVGTTLESKEAEDAYVQAIIALYTAEYNVKVNETIVLELENQLVQRTQ